MVSDPLGSATHKLARADKHLDELQEEIARATSEGTYRLVDDFSKNASVHEIRAYGPAVPAQVSVIVGDIVHQLRSALDHLVCGLVQIQGRPVSSKHCFPICRKREHFDEMLARGALDGLPASVAARVERHQPYTRPEIIETSSLWVLRELSNTDKHRVLARVAAVASMHRVIVRSATNEPARTRSQLKGIRLPKDQKSIPIEDGALVMSFLFEEPEPDVVMQVVPTIKLVLADHQGIKDVPLYNVLKKIRTKVRRISEEFGDLVRSPS